MAEKIDPIWFILEKIQKDIDRMDEKQEEYLVASTKLITQLDIITSKVVEMNKLLTLDNGKPSIITQLNSLSHQIGATSTDVRATKDLVSELKTEVTDLQKQLGVKTPKEVRIEKWKTAGVVVTGLIATIPGILSFIHSFW